MQTEPCNVSPVQLNVKIGEGCVKAVISKVGVDGWNKWLDAMMMGMYMPLGWSEHEPIPPIWYWIDLQDADFRGWDLDGIQLGIASCRGARFDSASAVGAVIGCVPQASFRNADLREAGFCFSDISSVDFSFAKVDEIKLQGATFSEGCPPLGLNDDLLRLCKQEPYIDTEGIGLEEFSVPIVGSLTILRMPE